MSDEKLPIIIDNGSWTTKIGYSDIPSPRAVFPTAIGTIAEDRCKGLLKRTQPHTYIGSAAYSRRQIVSLYYPIKKGQIISFDHMEKIWHHAFHNELRINPKNFENKVLLTDSSFNPKKNREKMTQIMFETFKRPSIYIANQSVLSFISTGKTTGIVIDCGDGITHVVPIYQGYALQHAIKKLNITGGDITDTLMSLLNEKASKSGDKFTTIAERFIVNQIKEKLAYCAKDYKYEMKKYKNSNHFNAIFELPDGKKITVGNERFRCLEQLFIPSIKDKRGIHEICNESILACDKNLTTVLYKNIVLSGGTSLHKGINDRLLKEMKKITKNNVQIKIDQAIYKKYSAFYGGSMLASLSNFDGWITEEDYNEWGETIVHRKCF